MRGWGGGRLERIREGGCADVPGYMGGQHVAEFSGGQTYFVHGDHLGSTRTVTDYAGNVSDALDYLPYGEQIAGDTFTTHKFTGKERDSESGNDYFLARYYGSDMGRFLSPDPMGGHFLNPQSLNRYAYVHDNPLSLVDPFGLDCVYTDEIDNGIRVTVERGDCSNEDGTFVNGAIDTTSLNLTQADDGYSLHFGYSSYDAGDYTLSGFALPDFSPMSSMDGGFGFGSPQYAAALVSNVYQNTRAVTNPVNIAGFYAASATVGAAGLAAATQGPQLVTSLLEYGPQALTKLGGFGTAAYQLAQQGFLNPKTWGNISDYIQGYTPGPTPSTLWGYAGRATFALQKNWSQVSQSFRNVYRDVMGSVPH
jgi:RHS repeat-associated protein